MARKSKQLKLIVDNNTNKVLDKNTDPFFDEKMGKLAQGHYVVAYLNNTEIERNVNPIIFLYKWKEAKRGRIFRHIGLRDKEKYITHKKAKYYNLVRTFLDKYFLERKSYSHTRNIVNGLRLFIYFLEKNKLKCLDIESIDSPVCLKTLKYFEKDKNATSENLRCLKEFFSALSSVSNNTLKKALIKKVKDKKKEKKNKAISSGVLYQLLIYAEEEINFIITTLKDKQKDPTEGQQYTSNSYNYCSSYTVEDTILKSCFNNHCIYPFYLFFLINYGLNLETLKSWRVKKNDNGEYELLADDVGMFYLIDGIKNRSNSIISSVIPKNSKDLKYIKFLLSHLSKIYDISTNDYFFQYFSCQGPRSIKYIRSSFFTNISNSPYEYSFYKKYEIVDSFGERINSINHISLRKSHNHQDFLKGKQEFERQLRKNHKSGDTTKIFYENQNFEWEDSKKHKIALAQNLIVGIFKGEIKREEHKTAGLFENGPMADCKNNRKPTFNNAKELKENEFCSDWTKCLTECNKACVIPKIHGPVIASWVNYLDEQREDFLRNQDWEKEYLIDYQAAEDTLSRFTEDEIRYSKKEAYKYNNFVRIKFARTVKIKGYSNA